MQPTSESQSSTEVQQRVDALTERAERIGMSWRMHVSGSSSPLTQLRGLLCASARVISCESSKIATPEDASDQQLLFAELESFNNQLLSVIEYLRNEPNSDLGEETVE